MHRRNKPAPGAFKRSVGSGADFPSLTWATSRSNEFSRLFICDVDCQTSRRRLVTLGRVQETLLLQQQPDSQPHPDCHPHRLHRAGHAPLRPHVRGGWKGGLPLCLPPAGILHSPSNICCAPGSGSKFQWSTRTTSCTSGLWIHCPCRQQSKCRLFQPVTVKQLQQSTLCEHWLFIMRVDELRGIGYQKHFLNMRETLFLL